ncbi:MAG: LexA family protein [Alphaproteobacteria bacterium]
MLSPNWISTVCSPPPRVNLFSAYGHRPPPCRRNQKGDILVIDRSCPPRPGKFVVAETGGEFRVVRYVSRPATGIACGVWGVVTSVIRQLS